LGLLLSGLVAQGKGVAHVLAGRALPFLALAALLAAGVAARILGQEGLRH
jgi:hypothetical protein